jgi:hypothetical protein
LRDSAAARDGCGQKPIEGHRAIAATRFGSVERLVGCLDEVIAIAELDLPAMGCTAHRYRDLGMVRTDHVTGIAKRHDDALADAVRGFRIGRRQHDHKFRAAVPGDQIRLASVAAQNARGGL